MAWANLGAQVAEQVAVAASPIVAVLSLGAGVGQTGLLQTAQTLPYLLFSIPFGVLADRMSRRGLMAIAELARTLSLVAVLVLAGLGDLSLAALALLGFAGAAGTIAFQAAAPSIVPGLVSADLLPRANGRIQLARTVAFIGGPALAGVAVGRLGASPAFALAAASSLLAVLLLSGIREPERPSKRPGRGAGIASDVREGAAYVFGHRVLLPILLTQLFFNTAWFVLMAMFVPYAVRTVGLSASGVGATLSVYGVGMLVGALLAPRLMRFLRLGLVITIGPVCGLAGGILMFSTLTVHSVVVPAVAFFLLGSGPMVWVISTATLTQTIVPAGMLGRVSSLFLLSVSGRSVGAAAAAVVGTAFGPPACLLLVVSLFALQAAIILASPAAALRRAGVPERAGSEAVA